MRSPLPSRRWLQQSSTGKPSHRALAHDVGHVMSACWGSGPTRTGDQAGVRTRWGRRTPVIRRRSDAGLARRGGRQDPIAPRGGKPGGARCTRVCRVPAQCGQRVGIACGHRPATCDQQPATAAAAAEHSRRDHRGCRPDRQEGRDDQVVLGLQRPPPPGPRGPGGRAQAPGHVHRIHRQPRPHALPVGDHRQLGGRGPRRRVRPHRGHPLPRRLGRGARQRPRHPRRHRAPHRPDRRRGGLHQAARRRQVRRRLLHGLRRPARRGRVGRQRAVLSRWTSRWTVAARPTR